MVARMRIAELERNAQQASRRLKTLSNPHRLMILCNLFKGERTVGELELAVGLSQSAISQHLARLRDEGVVDFRRAGQNVYYSLVDRDTKRLLETLYGIYCRKPG